MSPAAFVIATVFVACVLLAGLVIWRGLRRTRDGAEFDGLFRDAYAKAPEGAGEDDADGEGR